MTYNETDVQRDVSFVSLVRHSTVALRGNYFALFPLHFLLQLTTNNEYPARRNFELSDVDSVKQCPKTMLSPCRQKLQPAR